MIDPLAEDFSNVSQYNYGLYNPILMVDPDGRAPDSTLFGGLIEMITVWGNKNASGTFLNIGLFSAANVTGTYINVSNPIGLPDLSMLTQKFMIQSTTSPKVVPINPNK